jgi:hypothetical protein
MGQLSQVRLARAGLLALGAALEAVAGVVLAAVFGGPGHTGADPPGNNGTTYPSRRRREKPIPRGVGRPSR